MNDSKGSALSLASAVDSEVPAKPQRRSFTAEYKKRILEEADAATEKGAIGAIMRRERIYSQLCPAGARNATPPCIRPSPRSAVHSRNAIL